MGILGSVVLVVGFVLQMRGGEMAVMDSPKPRDSHSDVREDHIDEEPGVSTCVTVKVAPRGE